MCSNPAGLQDHAIFFIIKKNWRQVFSIILCALNFYFPHSEKDVLIFIQMIEQFIRTVSYTTTMYQSFPLSTDVKDSMMTKVVY